MASNSPGRSERNGISMFALQKMFPTEESARIWFESVFWPNGRVCPRCGSLRTHEAGHRHMPYRCSDCRSYFSVKTGTLMEESRLPLLKWVYALYLELTSLKGISSMRLHREIEVSQKSAWFMLHRIRAGLLPKNAELFNDEVEIDETYIGGKRKNMSNKKRKELAGTGRGSVGKVAVVGVKETSTRQVRAMVVPDAKKTTLLPFIKQHVGDGTQVYTDDSKSYLNIPYPHEVVKHSVGEYVRKKAHTNGIESFWTVIKKAYHGTYHWFSAKHMERYVQQYVAKHNLRDLDTLDIMESVVRGMNGRRLKYEELVS